MIHRIIADDLKQVTYKDGFVGLPCLQELIVRHEGVASQSQFRLLARWLEGLLISSSLSALSLISDDLKECKQSQQLLPFISKHIELKFLNISRYHLSNSALLDVLRTFPKLEVLSFFLSDLHIRVREASNSFANPHRIGS